MNKSKFFFCVLGWNDMYSEMLGRSLVHITAGMYLSYKWTNPLCQFHGDSTSYSPCAKQRFVMLAFSVCFLNDFRLCAVYTLSNALVRLTAFFVCFRGSFSSICWLVDWVTTAMLLQYCLNLWTVRCFGACVCDNRQTNQTKRKQRWRQKKEWNNLSICWK